MQARDMSIIMYPTQPGMALRIPHLPLSAWRLLPHLEPNLSGGGTCTAIHDLAYEHNYRSISRL